MKTIYCGGGGRNGRLGLGLAGLCLFLAGTGHCAKNQPGQSEPKTNNSEPTKNNLWGDSAAISAMAGKFTPEERAMRERQTEQLKTFAAAKEKQAEALALFAGEDVSAEAHRFFHAAKQGDDTRVRTMFEDFMKRHRLYEGSSGDKSLDTSYWNTVTEVELAYECVIPIDPKSVQSFVNDTLNSIPPGSIYFGGTDTGRGLITAFSKSHADGDPFFTLTQNALADKSYLVYLRRMYGAKIYIPTDEDSSKCFSDYYKDALKRFEHDSSHPEEPRQIKPGEDFKKAADGRLQISGQVAVMTINGLLVKVIFDRNPKQEFYIEESFALDWMYPYLEPHGPIMKLNRTELGELSEAVVAKDREYWQKKVNEKLGNWLTEETSVTSVAKFAEKIYARTDLSGFSGDERYLQSQFAQKMMSKLRSSIGGVYDWRSQHAKSSVERNRMAKEADMAYRQAFALCPYSPEAVFRYVTLLMRTDRLEAAIVVAETALKVAPNDNTGIAGLLQQLKQRRKQ